MSNSLAVLALAHTSHNLQGGARRKKSAHGIRKDLVEILSRLTFRKGYKAGHTPS